MPQYPIIDDLEVELRSGAGIAVFLEGDSYEEDPWFYNEWFGHLALQVTLSKWTIPIESLSQPLHGEMCSAPYRSGQPYSVHHEGRRSVVLIRDVYQAKFIASLAALREEFVVRSYDSLS